MFCTQKASSGLESEVFVHPGFYPFALVLEGMESATECLVLAWYSHLRSHTATRLQHLLYRVVIASGSSCFVQRLKNPLQEL